VEAPLAAVTPPPSDLRASSTSSKETPPLRSDKTTAQIQTRHARPGQQKGAHARILGRANQLDQTETHLQRTAWPYPNLKTRGFLRASKKESAPGTLFGRAQCNRLIKPLIKTITRIMSVFSTREPRLRSQSMVVRSSTMPSIVPAVGLGGAPGRRESSVGELPARSKQQQVQQVLSAWRASGETTLSFSDAHLLDAGTGDVR
jgi:hypothetical protein